MGKRLKMYFITLRLETNITKPFMAITYKSAQQARVFVSNRLVYCLWVRPGSYHRREQMKGDSLGKHCPYSQTLY